MQHATHIPVCHLLYGGVNLGAKVYETGNLAAIRVEGGKLSITGNGLNAQSTDSAEIYARAIEINAGLWAKNARLATRANEIRYADGTITPIKSTENTPAYAPDLAAIGGMYANRIELVGTEKGLGVNLAGQITSTEATSLDVNGNLKTSSNLYTDGSTCIHADEIENSGTVYSKENTVLMASSLKNSGKIVSGADTTIQTSYIANTGTLTAAIAPAGKANDVGTLTIMAKELSNNGAHILSGNNLSLSAESLRTKSGQIAGNGDISLTVKNTLDIQDASVQSGRGLSIEASAMPLSGNLSANRDMRLTLHGNLSNEAAAENFGNLHTGRNLTANIRGNIHNQKTMKEPLSPPRISRTTPRAESTAIRSMCRLRTSKTKRMPTSRARSLQAKRMRERTASRQGRSLSATLKTKLPCHQIQSSRT